MRLKKQEGREILKKLKMTTIYMIVSAIFLTSCVFYYGGRFIYYYSVSKGKIVQTSSNLNEILTQAKSKAIENEKNSFSSNSYDHDYLKMREYQAQVLYEMYKLSSKLNTNAITSIIISDFLLKISNFPIITH